MKTVYGVEFVVTRNGEPISKLHKVEGRPVELHEKHDAAEAWKQQAKLLAMLVQTTILIEVDGLTEVIKDTRPVGLPDRRITPETVRGNWPGDKSIAEYIVVPILKRVNTFLSWLVRKMNGLQ